LIREDSAMLTSLTVEKYRGFERYGMKDLARVNLLVGRNNCGKSALLEAVHFVVRGGDPTVLLDTAWRRGEVHVTEPGERYGRPPYHHYPVLAHFFHGHNFAPGAYFQLSSEAPPGRVKIKIVEAEPQPDMEKTLFGDETSRFPTLAVRLEGARPPFADAPIAVSDEGVVDPRLWSRYPRAVSGRNGAKAVQFISPDSIDPAPLAEIWDRVVTEKREAEVIDAIRIVSPEVSDIVFLSGESAYRRGTRAGVLVGFRGAPRREPLGSHGDGMRRMLALSLALIQSEGGVLLADEIDTGLHYSIMGEMWRLVVETARQADVQVVATTHSLDCVRGLAWVCENHPDLREDISLQKIDPSLDEAVAFRDEEIIVAAEQGVEIR
jgi:hypothetical protein